jgi:hypothetical protein
MADYSFVRDQSGTASGIWLRDPSTLEKEGSVEVLLSLNASNLLDDYLAKKYRIVNNEFDSQGGCFVMFGSAKAPGEDGSKAAGRSSKCFVAAAVYGSYTAPQVIALSEFRDNCLMICSLGRIFVKIYYKLSPPFALWLKDKQMAKSVLRIFFNTIISVLPIGSHSKGINK